MSDLVSSVADIGARVKSLRTHLNLSQREFAQEMTEARFPWTHVTVGSVERGSRPLRIDELVLMAMRFGFSIDEFLSLETEHMKRAVLLTKASDELSYALDKINALLGVADSP